MQARHVPVIDARYWTGISLASIFGTNMGDFYAHESGLGLLGGLPILIGLFLLVYVAERFDRLSHDAYYWACIIIMRTGATNIADYMAGRRGLHIDRGVLSLGLGVALILLAALAARTDRTRATLQTGPVAHKTVPDTSPVYWTAMLTAGVFGTVLGDYFEHMVGEGVAALGLAALLGAALLFYRNGPLKAAYAYWLTVAVARTAGTAIGDWLAENKLIEIGLPLCTALTGLALLGVLVFWRRRPVGAATA